jgi:tryptophan-rich sensory protein
MPDVKDKTLPKWPLWIALSLLFVVEVFFLVMFFGAGASENPLIILNSFGLLMCCLLVWRGIPWSRWLLIGFLVWRVVGIVISLSSHFGDHRTSGSLILIGFYVLVGLVLASPPAVRV